MSHFDLFLSRSAVACIALLREKAPPQAVSSGTPTNKKERGVSIGLTIGLLFFVSILLCSFFCFPTIQVLCWIIIKESTQYRLIISDLDV
jgi:hypothetical protein